MEADVFPVLKLVFLSCTGHRQVMFPFECLSHFSSLHRTLDCSSQSRLLALGNCLHKMVGSFAIKCFYELKYLGMPQASIELALPIVLVSAVPACGSFLELDQRSRKMGLREQLANILPVQ